VWFPSGSLGALVLSMASAGTVPVSRAEILDAMKASQGYNLEATANGARLHAEVLLRLVRTARARDADGAPLFIAHEDWFSAYLARTGLEAAKAPLFARLAHAYGQDTEVDYRTNRVLRPSRRGPAPAVAANVRITWPYEPGRPDSFSYEDERASPRLRVTQWRETSYRLLDLGDMLVYADVRGLRGRPTSGALGALFDVIGEVSVVESRMAVAPDGMQVSRGRGRKAGVTVWATVTVYPDGRVEKGVPPGRPDLAAIEARLKRGLTFDFVPSIGDPHSRSDGRSPKTPVRRARVSDAGRGRAGAPSPSAEAPRDSARARCRTGGPPARRRQWPRRPSAPPRRSSTRS
jgi:hypothetical protein